MRWLLLGLLLISTPALADKALIRNSDNRIVDIQPTCVAIEPSTTDQGARCEDVSVQREQSLGQVYDDKTKTIVPPVNHTATDPVQEKLDQILQDNTELKARVDELETQMRAK